MATTADEVWQLLGELIQAQKETERNGLVVRVKISPLSIPNHGLLN